MKGGTEHKILRFLKDNDNGDFINVTNLIEDRKLLESKLQSLAKEPEKYISVLFPIFFFGVGIHKKENNELKAKIEINGIILLDQIENGDKNTTENIFNGNFNGNFIQDSLLDKSPIKNKVNEQPSIKPEQKSLVKKIFSSSWTLLFVGILIEELTLGKIWEYICSLI
jgi:hypothetical protein|tara:strand:- start:462 stop:965 length:504 start_codon:yes stop_codon:yes gene_type:complete